jgi:hypothetical protein
MNARFLAAAWRCLTIAGMIAVVTNRANAISVYINEFHYDNASIDTGEFIEIAGPAGTSLSGYSLVLYNGANGATYNTTTLSGTIANQQNGFGTVSFTYPTDGIQNGSPDGIALFNGSTLIQFLSYEGAFTTTNGPAVGIMSTDIGVQESGSTNGGSLALVGTGNRYEDFAWQSAQDDTPGAVNVGQTFLVVAVPEIGASTVLLLGMTLVPLAAAARRR